LDAAALSRNAQPTLIHDQKPADHFRGLGAEVISHSECRNYFTNAGYDAD
jgi:hypothetical protein